MRRIFQEDTRDLADVNGANHTATLRNCPVRTLHLALVVRASVSSLAQVPVVGLVAGHDGVTSVRTGQALLAFLEFCLLLVAHIVDADAGVLPENDGVVVAVADRRTPTEFVVQASDETIEHLASLLDAAFGRSADDAKYHRQVDGTVGVSANVREAFLHLCHL